MIVNSSGVNVQYVRNQKVASHIVIGLLRAQFGKRAGGTPLYRYPYRTRIVQPSPFPPSTTWGQPNYVFTLVHDPIKVAQSGYLEVSRRAKIGAPATTFRSMPCSTHPMDRYAAFLRSVSNGEPLGPELFHAFPQAIKLSAVTRFDRVVSLDNAAAMEEGSLALRSETGVNLKGSLRAERASGRSFEASEWQGCAVPHNLSRPAAREAARLFCRLYEVDYACGLPYARPPALSRRRHRDVLTRALHTGRRISKNISKGVILINLHK